MIVSSSSHQLLFSLGVTYKCIATMNSRVAFVSDCLVPPPGTLANYSTAPEIPFAAYSYPAPSQNQVQIQLPSQNLSQSPLQNPNPNPSPIQLQSPNPLPLQSSAQSQISLSSSNPSPIQTQLALHSPSPSPIQTQSPLQVQPSFSTQSQPSSLPPSQSQPPLLAQSKSKSKSQSHRHNLTELDFESILSHRVARTMSLDLRDQTYTSKKKDNTADSALLLKASAEKKNSSVYDVDSNGKLEPIAFFSQTSTNVISVRVWIRVSSRSTGIRSRSCSSPTRISTGSST